MNSTTENPELVEKSFTETLKNTVLEDISQKQRRSQSDGLSERHIKNGGGKGISGTESRKHDSAVRLAAEKVFLFLEEKLPDLNFRHRRSIKKKEINNRLNKIDPSLGTTQFVPTAKIKPDGGVIEVKDINGAWRVILVSESKHQGNDHINIPAGKRTPEMEEDGEFIMNGGNAIERVHKNIQEMRNFMIEEMHFPYVVFAQGSNFVIEAAVFKWPDGPEVSIFPAQSRSNRIDRMTAANFGGAINQDHTKNLVRVVGKYQRVFQSASIYSQLESFSDELMFKVLWNTAITSLEILSPELSQVIDKTDFVLSVTEISQAITNYIPERSVSKYPSRMSIFKK